MKLEFLECPSCSSKNFTNSGKPIGSESNSVYSVIQCNVCKLNWCSPMPTDKELNEYYTRYYEIRYSTVDKYPLKTKLKSIITFRNTRLKKFFSEIEEFSPGKSILDFGCGEADILYVAKEKGWKVLGVDYSNELGEKFKSDNIEFRSASNLDSVGIEKNSLSCISAKHVIEHIPDIENFLNSVLEYLSPKGVFAVKTPSASSNRAKLGLANWHLVRPMEHFWGFNIDNFGRLLRKNGFEILHIKDNLLVDELTCIAMRKSKL